jgi:cytosine/adenosine deaminase-related metal-dependent hydrolase
MVRFIGHYLTKNKEIYVFLFIVQTLFRGFADDLNLADWLNTRILPAETKWVSKEFVVYDK